MLSFLRKIRKALIESGSTRKPASQIKRYLLYSIGEIALVVIGILIALQINNWNINRLNAVEEERILLGIKQKMVFNQFQCSTGTNRYIEVVEAAERILLSILIDKSLKDAEELATDLHLITKRFLMGANNATHIYDELIGSGQLGLISSYELQERITTMKTNLELLASYELLQSGYVDNQLIPYLNRNVDRISISAIGSKSDSSRYDALINMELAVKVNKDYALAFQDLLEDQEFANLLLELIKQTKRLLPIYKRIGDDLTKIDYLINLEQSDL